MTRKPVVLVYVEGGVVQQVAAPENVQVTVHDHDNIKQGDPIPCVWCQQETMTGCFDGEDDNICPHCNNPTIPKSFSTVGMWKEFICVSGGKWKRISANMAECMENDSAFVVGDKVIFKQRDVVFPY